MKWMRWTGGAPSGAPPATGPAAGPAEHEAERVERASAGLSALFDGVAEDRSHAVLDLGAAVESSLQVYGRFARWIRFADLLSAAGTEEWRETVDAMPPQPRRPYDIVLAWNVFDRLAPEDRPGLLDRLVELTAPDARLHLIVEPAGETLRHPLRFALKGVDRMVYAPVGEPVLPQPPLLPADVDRLLGPFKVSRAFTSQVGFREYVALRR